MSMIHRRYQQQRGISLIEVMVGIVIGAFMISGLAHIFTKNKASYRVNEALSRLHEDGRFIMMQLGNKLALAGYRTPPNPADLLEFTEIATVFPPGSEHVTGADNGGQNNSDVLVIRYQGSGDGVGNPDGTVTDCLNGALDSNDLAVNTFSLSNANELQCQANNGTSTNVTTDQFVSNVEQFQVLYGEDTDADRVANRYVEADYAGLNMANVVSLRIGILISTGNNLRPDLDTGIYNVNGTTFNPADDFRLRRVFSTTIKLRNIDAGAS